MMIRANQYWLTTAPGPCSPSPPGATSVPLPKSLRLQLWGWFHSRNERSSGVFLHFEIQDIKSRPRVSSLVGREWREPKIPDCPNVGVTILTSSFKSDWYLWGTYHVPGIMPRPVHELSHLSIYKQACEWGFITTAIWQVRKQIQRGAVTVKS